MSGYVAHERAASLVLTRPRQQEKLRALLRFLGTKPVGAGAGLVIFMLVGASVLAPVISPRDPYAQDVPHALQGPSLVYFFGTDNLGRDVFSRMLYGAQVSLYVGLVAVAIGVILGSFLGLTSGFWGGILDLVTQRLVDSMMAFPMLVLALAVVSLLGTSVTNAAIAIGVVLLPRAARVVRSAVLSVKENQYIEAARVVGSPPWRIALRHILPNVTAVIIVIASIDLGQAILVEASLSFLGLGTQPPTPSWGSMLSGASRQFLVQAPWLALFPGLAITITVLAFNLLGDTLRDVWDPRLRGAGG